MEPVATANEEAIEAWDGVLFDRFVQFRHIAVAGLAPHGTEAMRLYPPNRGDRVLDIGCGFGDSTQELAELVGPEGHALGFDAASRFIAAAKEEAAAAGVENVSFRVGDLQATEFDERFDYAFSRFGAMFFASPVAALRNVSAALVPGGRLCMVVWRRKIDNGFFYRAERAVEKYLEEPEESDEPTCGPGPFSMANADTVSEQLMYAGFEGITLRRNEIPMRLGADLDEAIAYVTALGPAAEIIRLCGDEADQIRPTLEADIREALAEYDTGDGVIAPMSTWIITASTPAAVR